MKKITRTKMIIGLLATACSFVPISAIAQAADDVVVMRRVLAPPKTSTAPVPTDPDVIGPVPGSNINGYYWVVSGWFSLPDDTCSAQAVQTRYRGCVKKGEQADDALCPQPAPETERIVPEFKGCEYQWESTPSGAWASSCSASTTRPLASVCIREDGASVSDSFCSQAKPLTETGSNFEGCTYRWTVGEYGEWESSCSTSTFKQRDVQCLRSDGVVVGGGSCPTPAPATREAGENLTGCTFSWREGEWGAFNSQCSENAVRTRVNSCVRSDTLEVDTALCDAATQPPTQETQSILGGCGYEWVAGEYGEWSSTCSANASRTRDISCRRTDGVTVDGDFCAGEGPEPTEVSDVSSSCTYEWEEQAWNPEQVCGTDVPQTRNVICRRSDGSTALDSLCTSDKPETSRTTTDFSSCSYSWEANPWGEWSSTCSDNATRSRTASCKRQDGEIVADSFCEGKTLPALTDQNSVYTGCEKVWTTTNWTNYNSTCSANSTRTRSVGCQEIRPSGSVSVNINTCDQSTKPASSESIAIYTGCTNAWVTGTYGWMDVPNATSSTCSWEAQQTRTVQCRSTLTDGTQVFVPDSNCTSTKPVSSRITQSFSTCEHYWFVSDWNPASSTCSTTARRTRTVNCRRIDGRDTIVSDSACTAAGLGTKPISNETYVNITDCTGILVNPGFEDQSNGWNIGSNLIINGVSFSDTSSLGIRTNNVVGYQNTTQTFNITPGLTYRVTIKHRAQGGGPSFAYTLTGTSTGSTTRYVTSRSDIWQEASMTFIASASQSTISFFGSDNLSGLNTIYIDDVVINVAN